MPRLSAGPYNAVGPRSPGVGKAPCGTMPKRETLRTRREIPRTSLGTPVSSDHFRQQQRSASLDTANAPTWGSSMEDLQHAAPCPCAPRRPSQQSRNPSVCIARVFIRERRDEERYRRRGRQDLARREVEACEDAADRSGRRGGSRPAPGTKSGFAARRRADGKHGEKPDGQPQCFTIVRPATRRLITGVAVGDLPASAKVAMPEAGRGRFDDLPKASTYQAAVPSPSRCRGRGGAATPGADENGPVPGLAETSMAAEGVPHRSLRAPACGRRGPKSRRRCQAVEDDDSRTWVKGAAQNDAGQHADLRNRRPWPARRAVTGSGRFPRASAIRSTRRPCAPIPFESASRTADRGLAYGRSAGRGRHGRSTPWWPDAHVALPMRSAPLSASSSGNA